MSIMSIVRLGSNIPAHLGIDVPVIVHPLHLSNFPGSSNQSQDGGPLTGYLGGAEKTEKR